MTSRRRRSTATNSEPVVKTQSTHEEMLEISEEREAEAQVEETPEEEEQAIEVFMAMALADTFEALQKAEEENGTDDFFDPDLYNEPIHHPAQVVPAKKKSRPNHNVQRVITRSRKS